MKDMVVIDKHYLATIFLMMTSVLPEGNRLSKVYNEIYFYNLKVTYIISQLKGNYQLVEQNRNVESALYTIVYHLTTDCVLFTEKAYEILVT